MKRVKIGIVGCGDIATKAYFSNIVNRYHNLELYAVADLVKERVEAAAQQYNVPHIMTLEEMCADPEIEIILNLTNPKFHYPINMQILNAGKHLYTEKPFALSLEEARNTLKVAREKNLRVGCAPDTFMGAGLQTCKMAIETGMIGKVVGGRADCLYHGPECGHPHPDFFYKAGGGPMLDIGPYSITALLYLMGSPAVEISCYGGTKNEYRDIHGRKVLSEVNTHYNSIIKLEDGNSASLNVSWDVWLPSTGSVIQIFGTEGTVYLPDPNLFSGEVWVVQKKDLHDEEGKLTWDVMLNIDKYKKLVPNVFDCDMELRGLGLSEMADAIINDRPGHIANGDLACHVTEVMLGCDEAIATGKPYMMKTRAVMPPRLPEDFVARQQKAD